MVTIKRRFRGVKQGMKMFRASWSRKIYDRVWKAGKRERRMKKFRKV